MTSSALLCSMPAVGHVGPLLVVARELQRRGWQVRMLTGARYRRMVEDAGIRFLALPAEADTLDGIGAGDDERDRGLATINRGVERAFVDPAAPAAAALEQILRDEPADVVLHDMTFLGVQTLFSRSASERPLTVMCGIGPAGFSSRDTAPYGLGITPLRQPLLNRARNGVLGVAARAVLRPVHRSLDRFLAGVGAPELRGAFFMDALSRSDLLAQFTVREFEYPRSDAPWNLRFYGPMATAAAQPTPTPAWFHELDPALPLVHVTQGTVANTDYTEVIEPTLAALADLPVQVAVTTGGSRHRHAPTAAGQRLRRELPAVRRASRPYQRARDQRRVWRAASRDAPRRADRDRRRFRRQGRDVRAGAVRPGGRQPADGATDSGRDPLGGAPHPRRSLLRGQRASHRRCHCGGFGSAGTRGRHREDARRPRVIPCDRADASELRVLRAAHPARLTSRPFVDRTGAP
ncbi:hypothetical protein JOE64_000742 [Microbacterium dextranolyticum]|nr:glycosyltransferase [Microbacterium dextranolyticum]MBM7462273.1 hypothetical protein [Microbacterium dextranolyticum]